MAQTTVWRYPYAGISSSTDYFNIEIYEYGGEGADTGGLLGVGQTSDLKKLQTSIILPMPSNIQDGNSVGYGEEGLSTFTATALGAVDSAMTGTDLPKIFQGDMEGFKGIETAAKKLEGLITNNTKFKDVILKSLAAEAVSIFGGNVSINSLLARESGQIINPNMELLFSNVTLRTFRFSFKMTPRNKTESDHVKNIIKTLKQNMAPKGGQGQDFLTSPNVFQLYYKQGNGDHKFLHKFKSCFLKDMAVNYTGENVYATYADGTPVSLTMDLTFQEREPIYANEYDGLTNVGY